MVEIVRVEADMNNLTIVDNTNIQDKIFTIRGVQVILDRDLAALYQVETKVFNQAVKRNIDRFPEDFRFQLTQEEYEGLRSQFVTSSATHGGRRYLPYVFTEQGVSMLSAILKSKIAIDISIQIIRSFVQMRKFISNNALVFDKIDHIEQKLLKHDSQFEEIFKAIEAQDIQPTQGVFFDGQIFDAYVFISKLIKKAKSSIIIVDNYIDESVLLQLSSDVADGVKISILTKTISKKLAQDLEKHNAQYQAITIKNFTLAHDRFLIIDQKEIYHIGASLKDLGKKWFAFSKLDGSSFSLMHKINEVLENEQ